MDRRRFRTLDLFGLEGEKRIVDSGVRDVFTPHKPVSEVNQLLGREDEVHEVIEILNTPGEHALIYGERGVGKSSLANVCQVVVKTTSTRKLFRKRCDSQDSFQTIMRSPLRHVGAEMQLTEVTKTRGKKAKVGMPFASGEGSGDSSIRWTSGQRLSPAYVAEQIGGLHGMLVIDEVDALPQDDDRRAIAELVKHLSDQGSNLKIVLVGIAETGSALVGAHPSVHRCLREIQVRRMGNDDIRHILLQGADVLHIAFAPTVMDRIVALSSGYPHFAHLLALKSSEAAIASGQDYVDTQHLQEAMVVARRNAEGTLKRTYDEAIRSDSDMYRVILLAAARIDSEEFRARELRDSLKSVCGKALTQGALNNYLKRLVSPDTDKVLRRVGHGVYRFTDPRMRSYVRIANQDIDD